MFQLRPFKLAAAFSILLQNGAWAADALPALHANPSQTSVSGLSSGAFMAVQFHTAFSKDIMGAGIVAGGPYNCAYVNFGGIVTCMQGMPLGTMSAGAAEGFAALGQIDSIDNLQRGRVYLFSGTNDTVVRQPVVDATYSYYQTVGVPESQIKYVSNLPAGHAFITQTWGGDCSVNATPFINHCTVQDTPYDQAGAILTHIYGQLNPPSSSAAGRLISFDQKPFGGLGMGDDGFVYVPSSCDQGGCRVHVAFHGCMQTREDIGDQYYTDTGYNRWADANKIIVLYPQVSVNFPDNPQHCWDWFGYTGLQFNVKAAPQMSAVKRMIDRLTQ